MQKTKEEAMKKSNYATKSLFGFESEEDREKFEVSMATTTDLRVSAFLPISHIRRGSKIDKMFREGVDGVSNVLYRDTPWGSIEIRNRLLAQDDALVLLALMSSKKNMNIGEIHPDFPNEPVFTCSLRNIAETLGDGTGGSSLEKIKESIKKMTDTLIIRKQNNKEESYRIIHKFIFNTDNKNNKVFSVVLDKDFYKTFKNNVTINLSERLKELSSINGEGNGYIKSIVQHFLSHKADEEKPQNASLETVFLAVGIMDYEKRKATAAIKKNIETLKSFGITYIDKGIKQRSLVYKGTSGLVFIPKTTKKTSK